MTFLDLFHVVFLMILAYEVQNLVSGLLEKKHPFQIMGGSLLLFRALGRWMYGNKVAYKLGVPLGIKEPNRMASASMFVGYIGAMPLMFNPDLPETTFWAVGTVLQVVTFFSAHAWMMFHSAQYRKVEKALDIIMTR